MPIHIFGNVEKWIVFRAPNTTLLTYTQYELQITIIRTRVANCCLQSAMMSTKLELS